MKEYWVFNRSDRKVLIDDLQVRINPFQQLNLLKATKYKLEDIEKSANSGSLFDKKDIIVKLQRPHDNIKHEVKISSQSIIISESVGFIMNKGTVYNELETQLLNQESDEEYFNKFLEEEAEVWNPKNTKK